MSNAAHIVVVGGGAAGFFAAIRCAEAAPKQRVTLFERSRQLLSKVRISGGGRCNLTHHCFDPARLIEAYPRGARELRGPFHKWQPRDTIAWFEERGVATKVEEDGRVFPSTDDSRTVIDALITAARRAGVEVRTGCALERLERTGDGRFALTLGEGGELVADRVLLATGGLKPGKMTDVIEKLGHTITPLAPSLFTFHIRDSRLTGLAGISAPRVTLQLPAFLHSRKGPVLITHTGLSGPAILKLSAWAARELQEHNYQAELVVGWSGESESVVKDTFARQRHQHGKRQVHAHPLFDLPKRLWQRLATASGIAPETPWGQLAGAAEEPFVQELSGGLYRIDGKTMNKEEFVTCGGVSLREVDFRTMESRTVPGLFFAGEILDIDAVTGGYNFQAAWTTGHIAGRALAEPA